jgi:hypothetical protein
VTHNIVERGVPAPADVSREYQGVAPAAAPMSGELSPFARLRALQIAFPPNSARELKVRAYRLTPDGRSQGLAALAEIRTSAHTQLSGLSEQRGPRTLALDGSAVIVRLSFPVD